MLKLESAQWSLVSDIITEEAEFVTISMLYQCRAPGQIWVDKIHQPETVIAAFAKDIFLWGKLDTPEVTGILRSLSGSVAGAADLRKILRRAWPAFSTSDAWLYSNKGLDVRPELPPRYSLSMICPGNISLVQEFWDDEYEETIGDFASTQDFLQRGFGAIVVHEQTGNCVSVCAAISVSQERCDFGVDTSPGHEGLGLATACSHAAVQEAISRGKRPVWVAEVNNHSSQRVAEKLGFAKERRFTIYKRLQQV